VSRIGTLEATKRPDVIVLSVSRLWLMNYRGAEPVTSPFATRTMRRGSHLRIGPTSETIWSTHTENQRRRSTILRRTKMERSDDADTRNGGTANCMVRGCHHRVGAIELTDRAYEELG
jgi:hypothetical protein